MQVFDPESIDLLFLLNQRLGSFYVFFFYCRIFHSVADFFNLQPEWVWYPAFFLAVLFSINTLIDLARYAIPILQWTHQPIQLSPKERDLLGVNKNGKVKELGNVTVPSGNVF